MNIIFGSRRLGVSDIPTTNEKYPDLAVITIEAVKEGGKSRRLLFNNSACLLLSLESGSVNNIVFGSALDENGVSQVLISNLDMISSGHDLTSYKTSKNRVSFEGSKEKGKAISSSTISKEISKFLELNEDVENEFQLNSFDADGIDSFSMDIITGNKDEDSSNGSDSLIDEIDDEVEVSTGNGNDFNFNESDEKEDIIEMNESKQEYILERSKSF